MLQLIGLLISHFEPLVTVNDVQGCIYPCPHRLQSERQKPVCNPGKEFIDAFGACLLKDLLLVIIRSIDRGCRTPRTIRVSLKTFLRCSDFTVDSNSLNMSIVD